MSMKPLHRVATVLAAASALALAACSPGGAGGSSPTGRDGGRANGQPTPRSSFEMTGPEEISGYPGSTRTTFQNTERRIKGNVQVIRYDVDEPEKLVVTAYAAQGVMKGMTVSTRQGVIGETGVGPE